MTDFRARKRFGADYHQKSSGKTPRFSCSIAAAHHGPEWVEGLNRSRGRGGFGWGRRAAEL